MYKIYGTVATHYYQNYFSSILEPCLYLLRFTQPSNKSELQNTFFGAVPALGMKWVTYSIILAIHDFMI